MDESPYEMRQGNWDGDPGSPAFETESATSKLTWIHIVAHDVPEVSKLLAGFGFSELLVEDALSLKERPSVHESNGQLFLVAPFVHSKGPDEPEDFAEVAFFVEPTRVVTVSLSQCPLIRLWFAKWLTSPSKYGDSPADLLHTLLDAGVDGYFPAVDVLEDVVDDLESSIYEGGREVVREAISVKRRLLELRRRVAPLRDVINSLLRRDVTNIPPELKPYFQDLYDHTIRISESVDTTRDILSSVLDAHLSIVSNNLNQVMKKMTVISTLLMTAALVAGVYGMNFKFMPELDWKVGYPLSIALMIGFGLVELWYFRRKGWV